MLVILTRTCSENDLQRVIHIAEKHRLNPGTFESGGRTVVALEGDISLADAKEAFLHIPAVEQIIPLDRPRISKPQPGTPAQPENPIFTKGTFTVIAGPCSVESEDLMLPLARRLRAAGATLFRGGVFKPRTSPYSFQGLQESGLQTLTRIRSETGLKIITEAMSHEHLDQVCQVADVIQIGSRNMQNTPLLNAVGELEKPVMLKRGMASTVKEWLLAAEYIASGGNEQIVLCERGVRTFADHSRFTLDLSVVPAIQASSGFPVVIDPSHGTGKRQFVPSMSRAAIAAGADGLMIEVHPAPDDSISDAEQAIEPEQFESIMKDIGKLAEALGIRLN